MQTNRKQPRCGRPTRTTGAPCGHPVSRGWPEPKGDLPWPSCWEHATPEERERIAEASRIARERSEAAYRQVIEKNPYLADLPRTGDESVDAGAALFAVLREAERRGLSVAEIFARALARS